MSFEDVEASRAARAVKDAIKSKGKHRRKRKSVAIEADKSEPDEPDKPDEPEPDELEADSELEVARMIDAPVARII